VVILASPKTLAHALKLGPQGQHQNNQHLALRPAPRTARRIRTRRRDHPTHPARAVPLLRRAHAHHRDLPSRAKANVARTTTGAGRMTHRLSDDAERHWLLSAGPAKPICVYHSAARKTTASTTMCNAVSAYFTASVTVSAVMRNFPRTSDTELMRWMPPPAGIGYHDGSIFA